MVANIVYLAANHFRRFSIPIGSQKAIKDFEWHFSARYYARKATK